MKPWLVVAFGGAVGSVTRYTLSGWVLQHSIALKLPLGTFLVNILGCLIAGVLAGLSVKQDLFSQEARLLLFTGLLGGFTTFSAFGLETFHLLRRGEVLIAGLNVLLSTLAGILVLWLGFHLIPSRTT